MTQQDLNHFKLHGTVCYRLGAKDYIHNVLFAEPFEKRLHTLMKPEFGAYIPPILFPWEILDDAGGFIPETDFVFLKGMPPERQTEGRQLYKLYRRIWMGARAAVMQATKISFVGLSAHEYMESGFRYLFKDKTTGVEAVVANKENEHWKGLSQRLHPATLCGRTAALLKRAGYVGACIKSASESDDGMIYEAEHKGGDEFTMTPRSSFAEFILREMN